MSTTPSVRLQPHLGRVSINYKNGMNLNGLMTLARVTNVHQKSGTADVVTVQGGNIFSSSASNEGAYAARILTSYSDYDSTRKKYWGEMNPIGIGTLVLIGFMDNKRTQPVILGTFHYPDNNDNVLPSVYPLSEQTPGLNRQEAYKTLHVYPSQAYSKIDGESNVEFSHASKSFLAMYNTAFDVNNQLNDTHGGFDHANLSEKDKVSGSTLETDFENAQSPTKLLYVHRTNFSDLQTTWIKLFLDATGMFRLSRDNNDGTLSYREIDPNGTQTDRVQVDSNQFGSGQNYIEVVKGNDGSININRGSTNGISTISIDKNGIITLVHSSGSFIQLDEDLQMEIQGDIFSDALSSFIEKYHLVVSNTEPQNPREGLVWIDTSE